MPKPFVTLVAVVLLLSLSGCGGMSDQDRLKILVPNAKKTTPVKGKVLVDGKPMKNLWVTLHPENETPDSLLPKAQTDANGHFAITTYIGGDGAPAGKYKITVEWLTYRQFGAQWVGPNKLEDKFGQVSTTPFEVTVGDKPITLPDFAVMAKPEGEVKKPAPGSRRAEKMR
jgi:5-hydroxyisourate hydrolase-like protein (transthyretin family)